MPSGRRLRDVRSYFGVGLRGGLLPAMLLLGALGPVGAQSPPGPTPTADSPTPRAGCPAPGELLEGLRALPLEQTTRATLWEAPWPSELLEKAAAEPGTVVVHRDGRKVHGLVVAELPREALWRAINDEDRYAEALGLAASRVLAGTPRGSERLIFQAFRRMGVGRWWIDRVQLNGPLARETEGLVWELTWTDAFDALPVEELPEDLAALAGELRPVEWTRGAWAFASLSPGCTVVDYFVWSDPGGVIGGFQALGATKAARDSVEGLVGYARRGEADRPGGPPEPFVDPHGMVLETALEDPSQGSAPPSDPSAHPSPDPVPDP